jgi:single-strand DNA-binding protein
MASSFNKFIGVGNLTRDAESRMVGESEVARYAVAINGRKRKDGSQDVMFMDCDHWRVGNVLAYLTRGTTVLVEGELEQQHWEKDGQKKSKVVLQVQRVQLLGGKRQEAQAEEEEFAEFR